MSGEGTFAFVPVAENGEPLAVVPSYGPDVLWDDVDRDVLSTAVTSICGAGATLAGEPLDPSGLADPSEDVDRPPRIDALVWTTHEGDALLAAAAYRFGMGFHVADASVLGRLVTPEAQTDRAFFEGVWAMTDGMAVWRSGAECGAAFVKGKTVGTLTWLPPALAVDPSLPAQTLGTGWTISATLAALARAENDTAPWVTRFGLDPEHASRLRALSRRDASDTALRELQEILRVPRRLVDALDSPSGVRGLADAEAIRPRGIRRQFLDAAAEDRKAAPRWRRSRTWLVVSLVAIVALGGWSVLGIATGRVSTAFIPGLVALAWAATLLVGRLASHGDREYAHGVDADDRVRDWTGREP
ncbi:MAG: hypothetical protein ABWY03_01110 [Microbacterium sp.]